MRHGAMEGREEVDRLRDWVKQKVGAAPEEVVHPMFGEIIKDIGYKRVYCISCEKVSLESKRRGTDCGCGSWKSREEQVAG
jgi:hypothetical protein